MNSLVLITWGLTLSLLVAEIMRGMMEAEAAVFIQEFVEFLMEQGVPG